MAWLDFIKAIRQSDDDEKKRGGVTGGFLNAIDNGIDGLQTGARKVSSQFNQNDGDYDAFNVLRDLPSAGIDAAKKVGKGVGEFAEDTAQGFARGIVNTGLTVKESMDDDADKTRLARLKEVKNLTEAERNKIADDDSDPRSTTLKLMKRELGSLSDEALNSREKAVKKDQAGNKTYTPTDGFMKALIGGEDNEKAQSAQKTAADADKGLVKAGVDPAVAGFLAPLAGTGSAVLDAPTGIGGAVKQVGTQGVKQIAKESSADGVARIIRARLPSVSDDVVNELAPRLASLTDPKQITQALNDVGANVGRATKQAATDVVASATDSVKAIVPGLKSAAQTNQTLADKTIATINNVRNPKTPKPTGYGSATDELLGRIKYGSEIDKPAGGVKQQLKEQFYDKLSPVNDLVKTFEETTGRKLATEDNPYQLMRLYQGMPDRVQSRVNNLTSVLKQAPDINSVKAIGMARQIIDRDARDISSTISADTARKVIEEQRTKLGDEAFNQAASVVDNVNKYNIDLLTDLKDEGIISDDAFKAIMDTGTNYFSKFNVIEYIMKDDANRALFASGGSYNTTKQTLNKVLSEATGMKEGAELLDPIESIVRSTDATMRAVSKNQIWKSFDRMADDLPDLIQRVRDPDNVVQRISLSQDNAELRPIRNGLDRLIKSDARGIRRLQTAINQLERKGMNISLKDGGQRMVADRFAVDGLGGKVATSQAGKNVATTGAEKRVMDFLGEVTPTNPNKLGPTDTAKFLNNLIENGSRSQIDRIKKMVGNRDAKLNDLLDNVGSLKTQYDEVAGVIRENTGKIRKDFADKEAPDGYALISGFGQGQQGKLAVPKELADVFTGKNAAQQDYLTSVISSVNGFVKQNFTSNNPAFALITNPIRDAKSFAYNAKDVKSNPVSIGLALTKGLAERVKRGDAYDRWVEAGGRSGFYADERTGERIAKDFSRKINGVKINSVGDFIREAGRFTTAPLRAARDTLQGAASILEDAPRVAQFQASLKAGKSDAEAAYNARNVTVDFQQSGRIGQTINAWVPFLNARFQGTLKSAEAIKNNPARAASVYAGLTAAPIALAALNNAQYPEVMSNMLDGDRDNNFVLIFGDRKDENGKYDQVMTIPKGDVDKILGNPLENFMRFLADDDPRTLQEMVTNMIGSVLPVDVVKDDKFNPSRAVGSILPPLIKAPIENATNRSLYFDSDLVPANLADLPEAEQKREDDPLTDKVEKSTGKLAEFMAPLLGGGSPIKSENTIRNFTGSLLTEAPQDQLGGKLNGVSSTKMNNEFYKTLGETAKNRASASKFINESIARGDYAAAQKTAENYNAYLAKKFAPLNETYRGQITPDLYTKYSEQKISLTSRSIKQRQRNQLERAAAQ